MEDIEIEAFKLEAKKVEDLKKNAKKYIQIAKKISKRYKAKFSIIGSFSTKKFVALSDLDMLFVLKDEKQVDKLRIELRKRIKNPKVNFHFLVE